jgi:hypothetical protein
MADGQRKDFERGSTFPCTPRSPIPARSNRAKTRLLPCLLLVQALVGCNQHHDRLGAPPAEAAESEIVGHGHFRGTITIGGQSYHAEALLTVDDSARIYIGAPLDGPLSGAGLSNDLLNPEESAQFVGNLELDGDRGFGNGVVIGQQCAASDPGSFCDAPALAEIRITEATSGRLTGWLRVSTNEGEDIWILDVGAWSLYYEESASVADPPRGVRNVQLAHFAQSGDVILTIDPVGRFFFQGPNSGCTGNGTLVPHLDGEFYVFDVALVIENCGASYSFLNKEFTGLAIATQDNAWGYDFRLLMFLSTPDGAGAPAAVTMFASGL